MRPLRTWLTLSLLAAAVALPVAAAPHRPAKEVKDSGTPEEQAIKAQARAAYQRATKHYNLNEFQEALTAFKDAYRLFEDPSFLFNIAQCQRQLGLKRDSVRSYRSFLRAAPQAPNRGEVERLMAELEAEMREESVARPPVGTISPSEARAVDPEAGKGSTGTTTPASVTSGSGERSATPATTTPTDVGPAPRPIYKRWWLWTAIVVVVGAGVGLGLGLGLSSSSSESFPMASTSAGTFRF